MKKTLSLALAIIMCITSLSFATNVFAADSSNCATVLLDGVENNSLIDDTANAINECRTASGKTAIQLDNTLCEQAKQRAKDYTNRHPGIYSLEKIEKVAMYLAKKERMVEEQC